MIAERSQNCISCRIARFISRVSAPPLVLLATASAVCAGDPAGGCWRTFGTYVLAAVVAPLVVLVALKCAGYVEDFDLTNRSQRAVPLAAATFGSAIASMYLSWKVPGSSLAGFSAVQTMMLGALFLISCFWKISIHAAGMAAFVAVSEPGHLAALATLGTAFGVVGWSRVVLGKHTIGQFIAGGSLSTAAFSCWRIF